MKLLSGCGTQTIIEVLRYELAALLPVSVETREMKICRRDIIGL